MELVTATNTSPRYNINLRPLRWKMIMNCILSTASVKSVFASMHRADGLLPLLMIDFAWPEIPNQLGPALPPHAPRMPLTNTPIARLDRPTPI